jgi:3-hexulose-6-phosphate synthase
VKRPLLQIALDIPDGDRALEIAGQVAHDCDIIEAGTPLIKSCGIGIVRRLKETFPERLICADMKTADAGAIEANLALDHAADIVTVLGSAPVPTIWESIHTIQKRGKTAVVDTLGLIGPASLDIPDRIREIMDLEPDYIGIHAGIDEEKQGYGLIEKIWAIDTYDTPLQISGGITLDLLQELKGIPIGIVAVGRYITDSENPWERVAALKTRIETLWERDRYPLSG